MSGFSADWLALREPADGAARSAAVTEFVAEALAQRAPVTCVDLGAGTGANVRYLRSRLAADQRWRLVDDDEDLLARARVQLGTDVDTDLTDLRLLEPSILDGADLVTASALLDLVSEQWLDGLVSRATSLRAAVLFALNYDGRVVCAPNDRDDDRVRDLVNAHQRNDKGFGPALGPSAGARAEQLLRRAGYNVRVARSDWVLDAAEARLQGELLRGWASAACDIAPVERERIAAWLSRRLDLLASSRSELVVGHVDVGGVMSG